MPLQALPFSTILACRSLNRAPKTSSAYAMSGIDADSSSEDEGDYKTTSVTLGYASIEATGDDISHLGGHPVGTPCITFNI